MGRRVRVLVTAIGVGISARAEAVEAPRDPSACITESEEAQRLALSGKLREARERFAHCAQTECPTIVRQDCAKSFEQVAAALPTVVLVARDLDGKDVRAVRVLVDGAPFLDGLDGRAVPVDPGARTFRYEPSGAPAYEEQVVVREGEKRRVIDVKVASRAPRPAEKEPRSKLVFIFGAIAAVTLGVGTYFGVTALGDYDAMKDGCGAARTCSDSEIRSVRVRAGVADGFFGAALVSAGVAVWLYFRGPGADAKVGLVPRGISF